MDEKVEEILARAEAGEINAQINLAERYLSGEGVKKSREKAADWYRRSAEQGFPQGQACLGVCYERGVGVKRDLEKAVEWYKKAAEQRDRDAQERLAQLLDKDGRIRPAPAGSAARKPLSKAVMIGLAAGALAGSFFGGIGVIVGAVAGFFAGTVIGKKIKGQ
ncbi:MAG: sel1 repeat family protein [Treponema sp.]|jgi:TPR repeat protein|nr:sel1 repeat family protein [Treponema sp.]